MLGGSALALAALVLGAIATREVIDQGRLLDYTPQYVELWRVFGSIDLYVAREDLRPLDTLNGVIILGGAVMATISAMRLRAIPGPAFGFFCLLAAGFLFLGLDELLALHETIGYNLDFLADLPGVSSPEDAVFALYGVPAVIYFYAYRRFIATSPTGMFLVGLGLILFVVAAALDVLDRFLDEQFVEVPASLLLVAGFTVLALHQAGQPQAGATLPLDAADREGAREPAARA